MTVLTSGSALASAASAAPKPRRSLAAYWLIAPGVAWMVLFLLLPILMMVYVSFWTQTTFKVEPILTAKSWVAFFSSPTWARCGRRSASGWWC